LDHFLKEVEIELYQCTLARPSTGGRPEATQRSEAAVTTE